MPKIPKTGNRWPDNPQATVKAIEQLRDMSEENLQELEAAIQLVRQVRKEMEWHEQLSS